MRDGRIETENSSGGEVAESQDPFLGLRSKPSQLSTGEVKKQIASSESEVERRNLSVALEKKYTTLFLPFIMALFAAPFALSLSRKGNVVTVGYSIGLWLLFTGTNSVFEQLGLNGLLSPTLAVWSPLVIFSMFGVYLLTKVRT
ncbi:MAG: LptF/LptG family permease [Chloracidobacterium sp.]|nr:LptF/LptG family permease [Chloracidobacterium sp.]